MFASTTSTSSTCAAMVQPTKSVVLRMPLFTLSPLAAKHVQHWKCKDVQLWLHFVFDWQFGIPLGEDADLQDKIAKAQVDGMQLIKNVSNLRYYFTNIVLIDDVNCRKSITEHVKKLEQNNWRMMLLFYLLLLRF